VSTAPVLLVGGTGAAAASHTTASFTPAANTRLLAFVGSFKATVGVALPTIVDSVGLSWALLSDYVISTFANPDMRGSWFLSSSVGGSPATMTVTVASAGGNGMGVIIVSVLASEISGAIVQSKNGEDLVNGDPSLTFNSAPGATNITLVGASFTGGNSASGISAGYTLLANAIPSTARRIAAHYDITSAGQTAAYTTTNSRSIIMGIELAPAGAPSGRLKAWSGSTWALKPAKYWNGSSWVTKPVKTWNGSAWT
jgi:hypothetical protein